MRRITITINYKSGSLPSFRHDYSYCEIQGRIHCLFQYWTDSLGNFFYYSDQRCLTLCMCEVVNLKWKNLIAFLWDLLCLLWLLLFPAYLRPWEHYAVHWSFVGCCMAKQETDQFPITWFFPLASNIMRISDHIPRDPPRVNRPCPPSPGFSPNIGVGTLSVVNTVAETSSSTSSFYVM